METSFLWVRGKCRPRTADTCCKINKVFAAWRSGTVSREILSRRVGGFAQLEVWTVALPTSPRGRAIPSFGSGVGPMLRNYIPPSVKCLAAQFSNAAITICHCLDSHELREMFYETPINEDDWVADGKSDIKEYAYCLK